MKALIILEIGNPSQQGLKLISDRARSFPRVLEIGNPSQQGLKLADAIMARG